MAAVWAPFVKEMALKVGNETHPMLQDEDGWWYSDYELSHGQDYAYSVNDRELPDPRSPWQPNGVHAASRHVDHRQFKWTDQRWQARPLASAIIYELHIGTFSPAGTFDGAIKYLPHLVQLGITHVEVMPVAAFEGDYGWGYDGVALFAPHHPYGGPEALKRFINACHSHGLAVIMDVVYNHLGPVGNYLNQYGPYFTDRYHTPWGSAVNLDGPDSYEVRRFICDNARMWLEDYHCDGLRLDAVHALVDHSAMHILEELSTEVNDLQAHLGRHLCLIAESDLNDPRVIRPWEQGGFGINAQWSDDIHHALHTILSGEKNGYYCDFGTVADLAHAMQRPFVYQGRYSQFRRRTHGRHMEFISPHRFVAYLQNHDQLGNRAQGERLCHLVNIDRIKIGAALLLTAPYVPMLFQGEEWRSSSPFQYFVDFRREPELAGAVKAGRQKEFAEFGWAIDKIADPTDPATFERSKLNWDEVNLQPNQELLQWHRRLVEIRDTKQDLTTGRAEATGVQYDEAKQWLIVQRGSIWIACNLSTTDVDISLVRPEEIKVLLASKQPVWSSQVLKLPSESVAIFEIISAKFAGNSC
jgi:maltooligosyltrehalose trehalohydrolase